jgi:hypothetical protein
MNFGRRSSGAVDPRFQEQRLSVADPTLVPPLRLSLGSVEWLLDNERIKPSRASLFGFLLGAKRNVPPAKRQELVRAEMIEKGVPWDGERTRPSDSGRLYKKGIEILAHPEAQLRIAIGAPGELPTLLHVFLKEDFGALGWFDAEAFYVGAPVGRAPLANALVKKLRSGPWPENMTSATMFPAFLRTLTRIWPGTGLAVGDVLSVEEAAELLKGTLGLDGGAAKDVVEGLITAQYVTRTGETLALAEKYRPWLELLWSQNVAELEHTLLPDGDTVDLSGLERNKERLVFVGPPGKRALVVGLRGDDLAAELDAPASSVPQGQLITLTALPREILLQTMRTFLRIE